MEKKLFNILFITLALFCFSSCEDTDYLEYDQSQKDGIFFDKTEKTDSLFYNFGFYEITENTINIPVLLMGIPKDYDREFGIKLTNTKYADNDETVIPAKPEYFEIPEKIILKKDSTVAYIPVKLLRHAELENERAIITINLENSDDFEVRGHSEFTITFDDKTPKEPNWWTTYDMGDFNKFKGQLFFKYFWEMENEQKAIYDAIVDRWGKFLDIMPNYWGNSPLVVYRIAFAKYVKLKMYNYSQEHPELELNIKKPTF